MAEKAEKKPETPAAHGADAKEKKGGGLLSKTPVLLGGAMIIEAAVLFAGFKFLATGPKPAAAETVDTSAADAKDAKTGDKAQPVYLPVVTEFHSPNKVSGRTYLYDVSIYVSVKAADADKAREMISDRLPLIQDRIRTIIAQSDPDKLGGGSEPGLETLRRQVKFQLDDVLGPDLVQEVEIPQCNQFRTDM